MEFPYERQSTRLGPFTSQGIAMSTLRTADAAFLSAICKEGWKPVKMRLKSSRVPDSLISNGFRRTMVKRIELLIGQITAGSARPDCTLLAISCLLSATLILALQSIGG